MRNKSRVPDLPSSSLKETSFLEGQLNQARQGAFQTGLERKERNLKRNQKMGETFAYKEYLAGLLAGVATVITGHPFDTVKFVGMLKRVVIMGLLLKVKGLYRGATSSFVGVAFESSLLFGIYSQTKQSLQGGGQSDVPRPEVIIPSAAYGGAIISFVLCPTELVKCRLQIQGTDSLVPKFSRYSSPLDCALQTVKNEGFFAVLPLDVAAKTIIQTAPDKSSTRNPFAVLNSIYSRAGLKGCYTGLGPTILRAFPANAAAIVTWELSLKMLGINRD
uniref:Mitochondrial substrate carrier family protein n=1 Tax=Salix viminalis TaxID=40686 RepID=A0A6N2KEM3_SALVM